MHWIVYLFYSIFMFVHMKTSRDVANMNLVLKDYLRRKGGEEE